MKKIGWNGKELVVDRYDSEDLLEGNNLHQKVYASNEWIEYNLTP